LWATVAVLCRLHNKIRSTLATDWKSYPARW